jgi:hypothetical protein
MFLHCLQFDFKKLSQSIQHFSTIYIELKALNIHSVYSNVSLCSFNVFPGKKM